MKTAEKPTIGVQNIPAELRALNQWVNWKIGADKNGKPTKVPYQTNGRKASTTDPATWTSFDRALKAFERGQFDGIGFVFSKDDPYSGVDCDHCRNKQTEETEKWADEAIRELASYTEVSQSFTGWHTIIRGTVPDGGNKRGRMEMYSHSRFFCMTGCVPSNCGPIAERDLTSLHRRMMAGEFSSKKTTATDKSESEKDFRLIREVYEATHSLDADMLEKHLAEKYPDRYAERNDAKGERGDKNYFRYSIENFLEDKQDDGGSLLYFKFNDAGNADRLLAVYGSEILFVPQYKKWLLWDGKRWLLDEKNKIRELMRDTIKRFYKEAIDKDKDEATKWARTSLNSGSISNAILEARDQRAVLASEMDINRDLLNFRNGTLNLRTLALSAHNPADKITRLVDFDYKPGGRCLAFRKFLEQAVGAKQFPLMLRALGYALTGHTSEKVTFFCHGETNTGKTTLLNLFSQHLFSEYSTLIMADSLMAQTKLDASALSDLADLCGKRFVQTSETREGQRLDEATLKRITPGDALIRAVRKYELPFTFSATHKLFTDTNHELEIGGTGDDVWGRVIPIRFGPRPETLDKELPNKLLAEKESIVALLCSEANRWYSEGLGELPQTVNETRNAWKTAADRVRRFLDECCDIGADYETLPRPLYKGYHLWDKEGGEKPISETKFFRKLKEMMEKYGIEKPEGSRAYLGVDLQPAWKKRLENIEKKEEGIYTPRY